MNYKHGESRHGAVTPEYRAWQHMLARCYNRADRDYKNYGGRGIRVCSRWRRSFTLFLKDVGPRPSDRHSLDRIKNDTGYEPKNCRWATRHVQVRNTRRNHYLTADGQTRVLEDWAAILGVHPAAILGRLRRGWSVKQAVLVPKGSR